jgi:Protein of unknown function (DUF2971)
MPDDALDLALMREWFDVRLARDLVVYHYTDAAGLLGIVTSGTVRGTNAAFLNDRSEISYGHGICNDVLREEMERCTEGRDRTFLDRVRQWIDGDTSPTEIYVASFSARRDSLSQWRGYGSPAGRYAIAFQVGQFSERDLLRLPMPVAYEPEEQRAKIRRIIEVALRMIEKCEDAERRDAETTVAFHLRRVMCRLKHEGFADEHEYRAVMSSLGDGVDMPDVGFLPSTDGLLKPWVPMLTGSRINHRLPIVEVQVGHVARANEAVFATRLLLKRTGYASVVVSQTKIPFVP